MVAISINFIGCKDDEETVVNLPNAELKEILIGSWQEVYDTSFVRRKGIDTITFGRDGKVQDKTGIFSDSEYEIINDSTICFNRPEGDTLYRCFKFEIFKNGEDYEITFYNFLTLSLTEVIRNVTYKKLD